MSEMAHTSAPMSIQRPWGILAIALVLILAGPGLLVWNTRPGARPKAVYAGEEETGIADEELAAFPTELKFHLPSNDYSPPPVRAAIWSDAERPIAIRGGEGWVSFDSEDHDGMVEQLVAVAGGMREDHGAPDEMLLIRVHRDAEYADVERLYRACGDDGVRIWKMGVLVASGELGVARKLGMYRPRTQGELDGLDLALDLVSTGGPRRFDLGEGRSGTLEEWTAQEIVAGRSELYRSDQRVRLRPGAGVLWQEVVDVLHTHLQLPEVTNDGISLSWMDGIYLRD